MTARTYNVDGSAPPGAPTGQAGLRASPRGPALPPRGFTLVEMLVIIIIIGLLAAITIPSIHKAQLSAMRGTSLITVNQLEAGCKAYANDFDGAYPPSSVADPYDEWFGGQLLPLFLTGYKDNPGTKGQPSSDTPFVDDGKDGFGFRVTKRSMKAYGPYKGSEGFKTGEFAYRNASDASDQYPMFVDAFDYPILYYCFDRVAETYTTSHNYYENVTDPDRRYGPTDIVSYAKARSGSFLRTDFLLVSKGPDGVWGNPAAADFLTTDDITNFLKEY